MKHRTLALRREVLTELTETDLRGVAGGKPTETCYSCLTYVSCYMTDCLTRYTMRTCADPDPTTLTETC